jgi:hypothetical protein
MIPKSLRFSASISTTIPERRRQALDLGREWYVRDADPDWRKWTVREAAEIFGRVGLVDEFWEIPVTEGGF